MSRPVSPRAPRPAPVTITDVARAAEVSTSTASRAFNHPHLLREDTVARVKAAADRLGFRHNRYAKALSTGRSSALGLIVPDLSNPFFPPLVHAAQLAAEEQGYSLYILSSEHSVAREKQLAALVSRDVAGLVLASTRMSRSHVLSVADQVPTVLINARVTGLSSVLVSAAQAISDAVADGVRTGASGVAYIGSKERWWPNMERETSARTEAAGHSLPYRYLELDEPTYDAARLLVGDLEVREGELVVAFDDIVAHAVLDGLAARGLRAPDDFRVLGCDDALPISTQPAMSTVHLDTRTAARTAIDLLLSDDAGAGARQVVVSGSYRKGETT
ncbi:LacI family DNA-binding transcriptional regulator [Georgenia sp. Z1491]|uniref:LacI family DNA-binding transcriptional regulator n=1 Tax=Georgenia sp. Z1491 TaxID=3416707 RepID=UPI003CEE184E